MEPTLDATLPLSYDSSATTDVRTRVTLQARLRYRTVSRLFLRTQTRPPTANDTPSPHGPSIFHLDHRS